MKVLNNYSPFIILGAFIPTLETLSIKVIFSHCEAIPVLFYTFYSYEYFWFLF